MTHPRALLRAGATLIAATAVIALTGCSGGPDQDTKDTMQTITEDRIIQQVHERATRIVQVAESSLKDIGESAAPCEGRRGELSKQIYTVQGSYQMPVPEAEHGAVVARLRDLWQEQGYTVTTYRPPSPDRGARLEAVSPDRYHFFVASTTPPEAMALRINSPCYRSPTPRY